MNPADVVLLAEMRAATKTGDARQTRLRACLSQREVGEACGVSASTVAMWETGQRTPHGPPAVEYGRLLRKLARIAA